MKVAGQAVLKAPVEKVWDALLDPAVLVQTIPGCESLEATAQNEYAMTVTAGVASIKGTYAGTCSLRDLVPHESLVMKAQGAGGAGTIAADVNVRFKDLGDGTTGIDYDADAVVGGMIGGVGQRMLTSVSKRMAGEFFGSVDQVMAGGATQVGAPAATGGATTTEPAVGQVFTAPAKPGGVAAQGDFFKGVLVGAGLVLAGVIAGGLFGRRRA